MARIRCHYLDCKFLDELYCVAAAVDIDPDAGCQTYSPIEESQIDADDQIEDEELEDEFEEEEWQDLEEDDEDLDAYEENE